MKEAVCLGVDRRPKTLEKGESRRLRIVEEDAGMITKGISNRWML